jgi:hypothetical protein
MVREDWPLLFGEDRIVREGKPGRPAPTLTSSIWRVVPHSSAPALAVDPKATIFPLGAEYDLIVYRGQSDSSR